MKVKLLKKIRERFIITEHKNELYMLDKQTNKLYEKYEFMWKYDDFVPFDKLKYKYISLAVNIITGNYLSIHMDKKRFKRKRDRIKKDILNSCNS